MRGGVLRIVTLAAVLLPGAGCGPVWDWLTGGDDGPHVTRVGGVAFLGPGSAFMDSVRMSPCDSVPRPDTVTARILTGDPVYENEVHDCQRLVVIAGSDSSFGPLVGLFPLDSAMSLPKSEFARGVAVATIYSWGDFDFQPQGYAPLGVRPGWQCLWLRNGGGAWEAAMTYDTIPCQSAWLERAVTPHFGDLVVSATDVPASDGPPATARWMWSESLNAHYIGIKCGNAWCSVGPAGFVDPGFPSAGHPSRRVPGWYDTQHLAVERGGALVPGPVATIYPGVALWVAARNGTLAGALAAPAGVRAVEIEFTGPTAASYAPYDSKLALSNGNPANPRAGVAMNLRGVPVNTGSGIDYQWNVTAFPPGGGGPGAPGTLVEFVEQRQHAAVGAARWRWYDTDEKSWVSCEFGCCTIQPTL